MTMFSFRAECKHDIETLQKTFKKVEMPIQIKAERLDPRVSGEYFGQFTSEKTLEEIRDLMRQQEDAQVMIQTLRPISAEENDFVRDYDIS